MPNNQAFPLAILNLFLLNLLSALILLSVFLHGRLFPLNLDRAPKHITMSKLNLYTKIYASLVLFFNTLKSILARLTIIIHN